MFDNWSISLSFSKPQSLSMASKDSSMDDMVKAVSSNPAYKVLTKEEYDILMSKHAGGSPKKAVVRGPIYICHKENEFVVLSV